MEPRRRESTAAESVGNEENNQRIGRVIDQVVITDSIKD